MAVEGSDGQQYVVLEVIQLDQQSSDQVYLLLIIISISNFNFLKTSNMNQLIIKLKIC